MLQSNFPQRFVKLVFGLFIYGVGLAMMVDAQIGIAPWDVLAQGISIQTGLSFGQATVFVSALVLLTWIPLRVKPGLGTIMNAIFVGIFADLALPFIPEPTVYWQQLLLFISGMLLISYATGLYISCGMGKGPRDGLNMGLAQRLKSPFWIARTAVEIVVVSIGFVLGGQVREGTLIFALAIGYLNQLAMRLFGLADKGGRV
ncbi:MAG TPA: hypothetical protein VIB80_00305 [Aquiluna sp.]